MKFFSLAAVALLAATEATWMKARADRMNARPTAFARIVGPSAEIRGALDEGRKGRVSKAEFMDFFYNDKIKRAEPWTDAEVKQAGAEFDRANLDHSGHVNIPELAKVVAADDGPGSTRAYIMIN